MTGPLWGTSPRTTTSILSIPSLLTAQEWPGDLWYSLMPWKHDGKCIKEGTFSIAVPYLSFTDFLHLRGRSFVRHMWQGMSWSGECLQRLEHAAPVSVPELREVSAGPGSVLGIALVTDRIIYTTLASWRKQSYTCDMQPKSHTLRLPCALSPLCIIHHSICAANWGSLLLSHWWIAADPLEWPAVGPMAVLFFVAQGDRQLMTNIILYLFTTCCNMLFI